MFCDVRVLEVCEVWMLLRRGTFVRSILWHGEYFRKCHGKIL